MSDAPTTLSEHDLREAFEAFLAQLRGPALTDFATASKALGAGFRKNPEERVVRAALSTHYGARLKTYHRALAECLGRCSAPAALLRALTPEAIEANGPALMARLGRGEVALAALQDDREPVRKAAEAWLAEPAPLPSPEEAEAVLKENLGLCIGAGDSSAGQRGEIARLRQELKDERAAHKQSRAEAKAAQDKAAIQAKADRATADFNLAELSRKVTELEAKLRKAEEEREGLVANEVARRLPQAFHGWLAPCLKAEAAVRADTAAPLLERAEQALADVDGGDGSRAPHPEVFFHPVFGVHQDDPDVAFLQVHGDAPHSVLEFDQLVGAHSFQAEHVGDAVAHLRDGSHFLEVLAGVHVLQLHFQYVRYLICFHRSFVFDFNILVPKV